MGDKSCPKHSRNEPGFHSRSYLGDAVYAQTDGYFIKLTAENGIEVLEAIYLEPDVLDNFMEYIDRIREKYEQNRTSGKNS